MMADDVLATIGQVFAVLNDLSQGNAGVVQVGPASGIWDDGPFRW